ncbi:HAD family hydrolase [Brevibacillus sp. SKDU10]|nr:HAD family hydrolase [Brevibacillus sp. SKDU10]
MITLADMIRDKVKEVLQELKEMQIKWIMLTGDN